MSQSSLPFLFKPLKHSECYMDNPAVTLNNMNSADRVYLSVYVLYDSQNKQ
jgi:hypothetical protein